MMRSFLLKLGMLVLAMGVVFWIGWKAPQASVEPAFSAASSEFEPIPSPLTLESDTNVHSQSSDGPTAARTRVFENAVRVNGASRRDFLDLNHATAEDLESLPGSGHALDQRVIAFLKSVGRLQVVEELRRIKVLGLENSNASNRW